MNLTISQKNNEKDVSDFSRVFLDSLYTKKSEDWDVIRKKNLLSLFKEALDTVPAYKKFLASKKIDGKKIKTINDFTAVPSVTKKNYLRKYSWKELCKNDSLTKESLVMTSTSGSTGEPFYFPRTALVDIQSSLYHEMFLRSSKIKKNKSTLVIDCFGMGVWIGGLITYQAFKYIGERGYPLTIITPGINKKEIFQALRNIGAYFDTIIICGYPPFIKDLIDDGKDNGILWGSYNLRIIFAAESFSETFRDYIAKEAGIKNIYRDTMNIYGSADLGTMAQETPISILVRRIALSNSSLYKRLFGQATRLPTFTQFIPDCIVFESKKDSVMCTGNSALPLIRYEIGDNGGVLSYKDVETICKEEGVTLIDEIKKAGLEDTYTELPFVYVYERSDFSASFYGVLIYPEYVKKALDNEKFLPYLTGKFTMVTKNDSNQNQYLEINVEIKKNQKIPSTIKKQIIKLIHNTLILQSTEYARVSESLGGGVFPRLIFWTYGHEAYFLGGAKQKWVKKI